MLEFSYVLNRYQVGLDRSKIEFLGAAGGMSGARFWRIPGSQGLYVLRRWPREHPSPQRLQFIHGVLDHAARRGLTFLPRPIATTDGRTFVEHDGHLWELAPWLPGVADYEKSPTPLKLGNALVALAKFHEATKDCLLNNESLSVGRQADSSLSTFPTRKHPSPTIASRLERLRELETIGTAHLERAIAPADWPELARLARAFIPMVPTAIPLATSLLAPLAAVPFAVQPCLRDVWHDHVLFTGDAVTGLIDFGAMDIDTPVVDVVRLLGSLAVDDTALWQHGLNAYATVRSLTSLEIQAVAALDAGGTVLAGCNWLRWIYVENRQFENRRQVEGRLEHLLLRLRQFLWRGGPVLEELP